MPGSQWWPGYTWTPEEFFGTVLAVPEFEQVTTGVDWTPEVRHYEFTPDSLRGLAEDALGAGITVAVVPCACAVFLLWARFG